MRLFEETVESRVIFRGKIVTLREDVARLENGALARREVVEHPDGVCILPMEADGMDLSQLEAVRRQLPLLSARRTDLYAVRRV